MLGGEALEDGLIDRDLEETRQHGAEHGLGIRLEDVLQARRAFVDVLFLRYERQDPPDRRRLAQRVHEARERQIDLIHAGREELFDQHLHDGIRVRRRGPVAQAGELRDHRLREAAELPDALAADRDPPCRGERLGVPQRVAHVVRIHAADKAAIARDEHDERALHRTFHKERARLGVGVRREIVEHLAEPLFERARREHGILRAAHLRRRDRLLRLRHLLDVPDAPDAQLDLAFGGH